MFLQFSNISCSALRRIEIWLRQLKAEKPKPPLEEAVSTVREAVEIAYKYKRDKSYQPTKKDLELFTRLEESLWSGYATVQYIERSMQQRAEGKPEGVTKFTDKEVFDYHYPP